MTIPITLRGRVSLGMAQNGAIAANGPGMARHMNAYETQKWSLNTTLKMRLAPLKDNIAATCPRRSLVLSECHEMNTMTTAVTA